jgi:hypothetical protein
MYLHGKKIMAEEFNISTSGNGKKKKVALIATGAVVAALGIAYGVGVWYFTDHFQLNTTINGTNYGGKTVDQVKTAISDSIADYKLEVVQRNDVTESIAGKDIDLSIVYDSTLDDAKNAQEPLKWPLSIFSSQEINVQLNVSYDEDKLATVEDSMDLFNSDKIQKPVSACISDYSTETGYTIIPEELGNKPSKKKTKAAIVEAIESLAESLDIDASGLYVEPSTYSTNEKLIALCEKMNKYVGTTINYTFGKNTETVNGEIIQEWLDVDDSKEFTVSVNEDKAAEYVKSLASTYDTIFTKHTFTTHAGKSIDIYKGDYGWWTNQGETTTELIAALDKFESGDKQVVYRQEAASYEGNDYGNTYAEVDLGSQYMYFIKDGSVVMSSAFVSGNVAKGYTTPSGIYSITYKDRNKRMVGEDYDVTTDYWLPFNGNIGFHDASWRSSFGGSIYKTNGSHGCVNMPVSAAAKLFSLISKGDPVICYY